MKPYPSLLSLPPQPSQRLNKPLHGLTALRWYRWFFSDPVASLCQAYRRFGPILPLGDVLPRCRERIRIAALGPEFNRAVLGNPDFFRTTGQSWRGRKIPHSGVSDTV